jgi:hypothetical protein
MPVGTKTLMKFNATGDSPYGWSEAYYLSTAASATLNNEVALAEALANYRIPLLAPNCLLVEITVSDLSTPRHFSTITYTNATGPAGTYTGQEALLGYALLFIKQNTNKTSQGRTFLKGVPADEWSATGDYVGGPSFSPAFAAFKSQLLAQPWGYLGESTPNSARESLVTGVALNSSNEPVVTVANAIAGLTVGQFYKISISGVQGAAAVNGLHVTQLIAGNQFQFIRRTPMFAYTAGGKVTVYNPTVQDINSIVTVGWAQRKDGRPFGLHRGRAKARVLA